MSDHTAAPKPCSSCPWLIANHGMPHPGGWFTKKNRARLWAKLREGDSMSCHKTDVENPVPAGCPAPKEGSVARECTGALILQQREMMNFQETKNLKAYRASHPSGLKPIGLRAIVERYMLGGVLGVLRMSRPNLGEPVGHDGLNWGQR